MAFGAAETFRMPFAAESLDHRISDGFATLLTSSRKAIRVAVGTPSMAFLLDEWRRRVERLDSSISNIPFVSSEDRCVRLHIGRRKSGLHAILHHKPR